jgi:hypothetical protein
MEERRNVYKILDEKPECKRSLERYGRIWDDNIEKDLKEIRCENVDCIQLS